jgi:hypothetical protein
MKIPFSILTYKFQLVGGGGEGEGGGIVINFNVFLEKIE